ncbi:hypothetical protein Ocin01_09516 [Orchesella cincta]|uniref:Zinc finger C2HC domain-containing protein 1C n=1 Tax=Orchesella cincta TaxID=48709 RepID=A0A1D2MVR1_ORCCI|nr:hypothetical protein Ocin01_09516 [Orchesella cincta]
MASKAVSPPALPPVQRFRGGRLALVIKRIEEKLEFPKVINTLNETEEEAFNHEEEKAVSLPAVARVSTTPENDPLQTCNYCGRNFPEGRMELHEMSCIRNANQRKRLPFIQSIGLKHVDCENEELIPTENCSILGERGLNWRKEHLRFVAELQQTKHVVDRYVTGSIPEIPPPPTESQLDAEFVVCPHCLRRFEAGAASRHTPKCRSTISNKAKIEARRKQSF